MDGTRPVRDGRVNTAALTRLRSGNQPQGEHPMKITNVAEAKHRAFYANPQPGTFEEVDLNGRLIGWTFRTRSSKLAHGWVNINGTVSPSTETYRADAAGDSRNAWKAAESAPRPLPVSACASTIFTAAVSASPRWSTTARHAAPPPTGAAPPPAPTLPGGAIPPVPGEARMA